MNLANAFAALLLTHMAVAQDGQGQGTIRGAEERKTYILTFKGGQPEETANGLAKLSGGEVKHVYKNVLNGAALNLPAQAAAAIAKNSAVERIEEDQEVTAFAPATAESWGQSRVDQCPVGTNVPEPFDRMVASSVRVYIIDTGIYGGHSDFTNPTNLIGPQGCHKSFYTTTTYYPPTDGHGHGTHVASTVCGHKYGVVTCKELCAVKVLSDSGSGYTSDVIAGIDFVAADCAAAKATNSNLKCIANMSLGGGRSTLEDDAVNNAVQSGVTFTVAAGNENANACNYSPAAASKAITVGATTSSDTPASFTNYGSCVDIYAPGVSIKAAWIGSTTATNTISGTSMASPHVCGLAAAALQLGEVDPETYLKARASKTTIDCRSPGTGISVNPDLNCSSTVSPTCPPPTPSPSPPPPQLLTAGVNQTLSIPTAGLNKMFYLGVPQTSMITCRTTGPSGGDADLYAKFGSQPTTGVFDARSISATNTEVVGPFSASSSDRTLFVMVYAYASFSNVQLWCDLENTTSQPTPSPTTPSPTTSRPTSQPTTASPTSSPTTASPTTPSPTSQQTSSPTSQPTGCRTAGQQCKKANCGMFTGCAGTGTSCCCCAPLTCGGKTGTCR